MDTLFTNLVGYSPQAWDAIITEELTTVGILPYKFREYDSPHFWVEHTLKGKIGKWVLSRDPTLWTMWCKIPLATAEVLSQDEACRTGAIPKQWLDVRGTLIGSPIDYHDTLMEQVAWIKKKTTLFADTGQSEDCKDSIRNDGGHSLANKVKFVPDPTKIGKPFIMNYTFFTPAALSAFMIIVRRHGVI